MNRGLLISFDGLDSSGKATQTKKIAEKIRELDYTVVHFMTPDYDTPSGKDLKKRLQGKKGDWENTSWQEKMGYFAINRAEHRDEVIEAIKNGSIVIYDRYVPSSLAFIAVEADAPREKVYAAVEKAEYKDNGMPQEDASIFLDVPPKIAKKLLSDRKREEGEEDEYTDALEVQENLYAEYKHLSSTNPGRYIRVHCTEGESLNSIEEVAEKVWQELISRFPQLRE